VVNVVMTRDIVPRAFVCDYTLVADVLKSWLPSFKEHEGLADCKEHKVRAWKRVDSCCTLAAAWRGAIAAGPATVCFTAYIGQQFADMSAWRIMCCACHASSKLLTMQCLPAQDSCLLLQLLYGHV
jgi:hypothetical protein